MIQFTAEAIQEIKRFGKQRHHDLSQENVRVGLQPGCCSDFSYTLSFEQDDDATANDHTIDCDGFTAIVSREYTEKLQGVTIDYSEDLMGGAFRYLNPNATYTSDCGNSFSIDPQSVLAPENSSDDDPQS